MSYQSATYQNESFSSQTLRTERLSVGFLLIDEVCERTRLPAEVVMELVSEGLLISYSSKTTGKRYFSEQSLIDLPSKIAQGQSKPQFQQPDLVTISAEHVSTINSSPLAFTPILSSVDISSACNETIDLMPAKNVETLPSAQAPTMKHESKNKISPQEIASLNHQEIRSRAARNKQRLIPLRCDTIYCKSIKLEVGEKSFALVAKSNSVRTVLLKWDVSDTPTEHDLVETIKSFHAVKNKLGIFPDQTTFNLHRKKIKLLSDIFTVYSKNHVLLEYGERSGVDNRVNALMRLHLSQKYPVMIGGVSKDVCILDLHVSKLTKSIIKSYLENFAHANGTHDRIVTYLKAATNFCIENRLLSHLESANFHEVKKLGVERHVIIEDLDLEKILDAISLHDCEQFMMFMTLQMTGQCRTSEVVRLRLADIDFSTKKIKLTVKGGRQVWASFPYEVFPVLENYIAKLTNQAPDAFIFPSQKSSTGHRTNFAYQWDKLRQELNFFSHTPGGDIKYQYRLHDFRETMVDRLADLDRETISDLLNHTSNHSIISYDKANPTRTKKAAQLNGNRLYS